MIDGLRPYPQMKPSGLPWAPEIPTHWELKPNRSLLKKRKILVGENHGTHKLLSLTKSGVIIRDVDSGKGKFSADMGTSQIVRQGDLIFCLFDIPETPRTVGLSRIDGMITSAYTIFECRNAITTQFIDAFYRSMDDRKLLSPLYSGLRNTIPPGRFLGVKTPLPTDDEQRLIVRFLNWHGSQTAKLIRAKKRVIDLLNEQKQAIVHRAVTRGLDPHVHVKPSGISWLADVPEHWNIQSLGSMIKRRSARNRTDLPLLSVVRERGVILRSSMSDDENHNFVPDDLSNYKLAMRGDLVINKMKAWQGSLGIAPCDGIVSPAYFVYQLDIEDIAFGQLLLRSKPYVACFARVSEGVRPGQWDLSIDGMKRIPVLRPPREEQVAIVAHVEQSTAELEHAKSIAEREIALIQEFHTRLLADVVTGQLDIRTAAADLPETIEPIAAVEPTADDEFEETLEYPETEEVAA